MKLRRLNTRDAGFEADFSRLVAVDSAVDKAIERAPMRSSTTCTPAAMPRTGVHQSVRPHVGANVSDLEISQVEMSEAFEGLPADQRDALRAAADRIREFHREQHRRLMQGDWTTSEADGTVTGQRISPLDSVGLYVPGAKRPTHRRC